MRAEMIMDFTHWYFFSIYDSVSSVLGTQKTFGDLMYRKNLHGYRQLEAGKDVMNWV